MTRIVLSVCGPSAVGKATLINNLVNSSTHSARTQLDLPSGRFVTVGISGSFHSDLLVPDISGADVVLHKWQIVTEIQQSKQRILKELQVMHGSQDEAKHRIVLLWLPWEQWWHGFRSKYPKETKPLQNVASWIYDTLLPTLEANNLGIVIEHYNWHYPKSGGHPVYERLDRPPRRP